MPGRKRCVKLQFEELEVRQLLATVPFVPSDLSPDTNLEPDQAGFAISPSAAAIAGVTLSVADFGTVGDGLADDTAAIQQTIDAVAIAGGGTVFFPSGIYLISIHPLDRMAPAIVIRSNVTLQGAGTADSIIKLADNQGNFDALLGAAAFADDISNFAMFDLGIDGNGPNNPVSGEADLQQAGMFRYAVRIYAGSNIAIENNRFFNQTNVNVITLNGDISDAVIRNNVFDLVGGGSADYDHSTIYTSGQQIAITDNTFTSRNGAGTPGARTAIEIHGSEQWVTGNHITGYFTGVNVTGVEGASINQVYSTNTLRDVAIGFLVWATYSGGQTSGPALTNVVIRDNDIGINPDGWRGFFDDADRSGVSFEPNRNANIANLDIIYNHIWYANFTSDSDWADHFSSGINLWKFQHPDVSVEHLRVFGNQIDNSPGPGIHLDAVLNQGEISGNTIVNSGRSENSIDDIYRSGIYLGDRVQGVQVNDNRLIDDQVVNRLLFGVVERTDSQGGNSAARNTLQVASGANLPAWSANPTQPGIPWSLYPGLTVGFASDSSSSRPLGDTVNIPVRLSMATALPVTVAYDVIGGTATSPDDYTLSAGTLTFAPGVTSQNIALTVNPAAGGKSVMIRLAWPTNASSSARVEHSVTIPEHGATVFGNRIVEEDGDIVSISLKGPGTLGITLDDPDQNGKGPIQVHLEGTTVARSVLYFKVTKRPGGDGLANVGRITGSGGLRSLSGAKVNLTGAGLDLAGAARAIVLRDLLGGADIYLGGTPVEYATLALHHVQEGTNIDIGSSIKSLVAARIDEGNIFAPSLGKLLVKGDRRAGLIGDMRANVFLSGQGVPANRNALKYVVVSHAIVDAIFAVVGGVGGIGNVTTGHLIRSSIVAGYRPDDLTRPMDGGTFSATLTIKSVNVRGVKNEGPAFSDSLIVAARIGTVTLQSVDLSSTAEFSEDYGILADLAIGRVTAKAPKFAYNSRGSADQTTLLPSRFHVKIV